MDIGNLIPHLSKLDESSSYTNRRSSEEGGSHYSLLASYQAVSEDRHAKFIHYGDLHLRKTSPQKCLDVLRTPQLRPVLEP